MAGAASVAPEEHEPHSHVARYAVVWIALVVLTGSTRWSRVRQHFARIAAAVAAATPGSYSEVEIPFD